MHLFIVTLLAACVGALIAYKLKIAGGVLIGALLGAALFNVITGMADFPAPAKVLAQIISGAFIGKEVRRDNLGQLKSMVKPAAFFIGCLMLVNILLGFMIYLLSPCDLMTALFAAVPGGLADISLISHDMGADTAMVAVFQLFRLLFVLIFFPSVIRFTVRLAGRKNPTDEDTTSGIGVAADAPPSKTPPPAHAARKALITLAAALGGGGLGVLSGIPAGALMFSTLAVSLLSVFTEQVYLPFGVKRFAMVLAGAFVGAGFARENVLQIGSLALPVLLLVAGYFLFSTLLGFAISRIFKMDLVTSLFACTPAGASDMALIASDLGGVGPQVAVLQLFRLFAVISLFPVMIKLVLLLWGGGA